MPRWNNLEPGSLSDDALDRMRRYRHRRLCERMAARGLPALLLYDPCNIRYATDARNMQVYSLNHDARYVFIAAAGPTVLFDWYQGEVYFGHLPTIDEVRIGRPYGFVAGGDTDVDAALTQWAEEIADLMRAHCPDDMRLGIDRLSPFAAHALDRAGVAVVDGQPAVYEARSVKSDDEISAMRIAIAACEDGFDRMRNRAEPGMTEVEIWSMLHQANIEWEGEWINARLLTTGQRTNPWSQETSLRVLQPDEVVGCDSDLIGPYGYGADISRTWIPDGKPTDRHRRLYAQSYEHIQANIEMCRAGVTFHELMRNNYRLPQGLSAQMFSSYLHGIGLDNEWPIVKSAHKADLKGGYGGGYDGVLVPGMTLCIESYVGEVGGPDGIKLEEQILITDGTPEVLSNAPFEEDWL